jgi:hypothetical protein
MLPVGSAAIAAATRTTRLLSKRSPIRAPPNCSCAQASGAGAIVVPHVVRDIHAPSAPSATPDRTGRPAGRPTRVLLLTPNGVRRYG